MYYKGRRCSCLWDGLGSRWADVHARLEKVFSDRRCVRQLSRAKDNWLEFPVGKVTADILSEVKKFMTKR